MFVKALKISNPLLDFQLSFEMWDKIGVTFNTGVFTFGLFDFWAVAVLCHFSCVAVLYNDCKRMDSALTFTNLH